MTAPPLVLASASPRRLALLQQAGIAPAHVLSTDIDETPLRAELPRVYAERMAREKLAAAASAWTARGGGDAILLAADTVVALGRRILPKAADDQDVKACLSRLSGRRHNVLTAVAALRPPGPIKTRCVLTRIAVKRLSEAEIAQYAASGEGVGKAGGYAIQGRAAAFIPWINGSYPAVVGLPLVETVALIKGLGFQEKIVS